MDWCKRSVLVHGLKIREDLNAFLISMWFSFWYTISSTAGIAIAIPAVHEMVSVFNVSLAWNNATHEIMLQAYNKPQHDVRTSAVPKQNHVRDAANEIANRCAFY